MTTFLSKHFPSIYFVDIFAVVVYSSSDPIWKINFDWWFVPNSLRLKAVCHYARQKCHTRRLWYNNKNQSSTQHCERQPNIRESQTLAASSQCNVCRFQCEKCWKRKVSNFNYLREFPAEVYNGIELILFFFSSSLPFVITLLCARHVCGSFSKHR